MTLIEDYGLESPVRKLLLLVLSIKDRNQKKEMNKLRMQKVIRYFEYLRQSSEIDFSNFKLGGVSYELDENLVTLQECGLIEEKDGEFLLSNEGEMAVRELEKKINQNDYSKLLFSKEQLNDLPTDELLYFMYRVIPETQAHSTEITRLDKKKELLIRNLFLKGKINACTAAKWLEINEKEFLASLPKKKAT